MKRPQKRVKDDEQQENPMERLVTMARRMEQASEAPEDDKFYTLDSYKVYGMTVPKLAQLTLLSEAMLYYCLNGTSVPSTMVARHICAFIHMDPDTLRELCKAVRHERQRRFGRISDPCLIPPPLFHYFKEIKGIGPSPKMEGKYKEMVESRRGKSRKGVMKMGREWFDDKAKKIAEQSGFAPDENGIYRKDQSASVVQALTEILGTPGLDEG